MNDTTQGFTIQDFNFLSFLCVMNFFQVPLNNTLQEFCYMDCHNVNRDVPISFKAPDIDHETNDFVLHLQKYREQFAKNFICGQLNINSVRNKFQAIEHILTYGLIDLMAICETKLDASFPLNQFHVNDFKCTRRDHNANGGGIMVYVRSDIPHHRRTDIEDCINTYCGLEIIILECIFRKHEKWAVIVGYKPPAVKNVDFCNAFASLCGTTLRYFENVVILGNYNCNILENCPMTDTCNTCALHNLVSETTCFKSINPTLLDVILVTKPNRFTKVLNCSCWLSEFHNIVGVSTKLSLPRRNDRRILYRSFKNVDEFHFHADLLRATDNFIYPSTDVNSCLEIFQKEICYEMLKTNIQQQKTLNRIANYGISQLKLASARDKFIFKNAVRVALRTHISGRQ